MRKVFCDACKSEVDPKQGLTAVVVGVRPHELLAVMGPAENYEICGGCTARAASAIGLELQHQVPAGALTQAELDNLMGSG